MIPSRQRFARAVRSFLMERKCLEGAMNQHVAHRHSDEINQLRAEIEQLRKMQQGYRDEASELRVKNERLRVALRRIADWDENDYATWYIAKDALKSEP